ncbi:hypothetical protein ACFU96_48245 [Streptomyces sp. NPDC057620]|uniref:hypothetical protein n=1 Tax=Streptomyces sp. NPDC057620 TaxID=3346185 RepID=UPI003692439F
MTDQTAPLTEQQLEDEDEGERYAAWLLALPVDQVSRCDRTTIFDWLLARHEQRQILLRAAVRTLREQCALRERAHTRLVAAVAAASA